jgi:hypothetical protein
LFGALRQSRRELSKTGGFAVTLRAAVMIEGFLWLALALPSVPIIVVVGGLLVVEYLGAGWWAIKILLAVISFGFAVLYGAGLFMAIYEPSARNGEPLFWAPFTGLFLISTFLLLRRPIR